MDLAGAVDGEPIVVRVAGRYKQIARTVKGQVNWTVQSGGKGSS